MKRGFTFIDVLATITLAGILIALLLAVSTPGTPDKRDAEPHASGYVETIKHDGHWFVKYYRGGILHHPDCPCRARTAEAVE